MGSKLEKTQLGGVNCGTDKTPGFFFYVVVGRYETAYPISMRFQTQKQRAQNLESNR